MRALSLAVLALLAGCEWIDPMMHQPKVKPYRASEFYPDQIAMRAPPPEVVDLSSPDPALATGRNPDGTPLARIPVAVSLEMLETGRKRYEVFCAVCHGVLGDGQTPVARNMSLRPPPALADDAARPEGFFFTVMTEGYGFMPSYRAWLDVDERWAIVAYLRALQLSQHARLDQAPPAVRAALQKETR